MNFPNDKQLLQAIPARHSVRKYLKKPIPEDVMFCLRNEIDSINARCGFSFRVVTNEPRSFKNIFAYGNFENAVNYIIISAPKSDDYTRRCGFEGERLVLGLQAMRLNTCWVGLSYSKKSTEFRVPNGHKVRCVISFGYGQTQGSERKTKSIEALSNADANSPQWFTDAMRAVQLAPTAINQQRFRFTLRGDGSVEAKPLFSLAGYTQIDFGITLCHFNLTAPEHYVPV